MDDHSDDPRSGDDFAPDLDDRRSRFATRSVSAGDPGDGDPGDVTTPIHLSSTFAVDGIDRETDLNDVDPDRGEYVYSRISNPTRKALEDRIAALEDGEHGLAFASGTSAIAATAMAVLEPGDRVVAFEGLYGGTHKMFDRLFSDRLDVAVEYVDATDTDAVRAAVDGGTDLVWMESPTNPLMRLCDVAAIAEVADRAGALLAVDNTFMSPYFQNSLALGADAVVHSTTKFLNGHSDSVGGAVVTDDDDLAGEIEFLQQVGLGNVMAPFDAYQVLRGTKTLPVRMRQHERSAARIATWLADHDAVDRVHYPGLESHPQHALAVEQTSGHGGVLSFEVAAGYGGTKAFLESLEEITLAVSLGGVETLIEHPASMTHSTIDPEAREAAGITDSLVRLSVGLEDVDDLLADLESALAAVPDPETVETTE